jgi:hypothetical protein
MSVKSLYVSLINCLQAQAAENRSKDFKQGGGGEKLKAKQKALEDAQKKNEELGGGPNLKWNV